MGEGEVPSARELLPGRGDAIEAGPEGRQDTEQQQENRVHTPDKAKAGKREVRARTTVCVCQGA